MRTPSVAPADTAPALSSGWYLYSFIAGIATALIVAAVAVFDPEMAENAAEAMIVVMASPPRKCPNHL